MLFVSSKSVNGMVLGLLQLRITVSDEAASSWSGDALAVGVFEEALEREGDAFKLADLRALDNEVGGALKELVGRVTQSFPQTCMYPLLLLYRTYV